jgi:hypothetical protein
VDNLIFLMVFILIPIWIINKLSDFLARIGINLSALDEITVFWVLCLVFSGLIDYVMFLRSGSENFSPYFLEIFSLFSIFIVPVLGLIYFFKILFYFFIK